MFSALNQGSIIYILDKTERPKFKVGEIVSLKLIIILQGSLDNIKLPL